MRTGSDAWAMRVAKLNCDRTTFKTGAMQAANGSNRAEMVDDMIDGQLGDKVPVA
jgi:hypothetical protein